MTDQAYDLKNSADFEANTEIIKRALQKIRESNSLKPTINELCNLTGFHRNSFRKDGPRGEIHALLKEIKEERKVREEINRRKQKDQVRNLEAAVNKACKEVVFWFGKFESTERKLNQLELKLQQQRKARDWYEGELKKERQKSESLQREVEELKDLLRR